MARFRLIVLAGLAALAAASSLDAAVTVQFDYRYDDGFFTDHPERQAVLGLAAQYVARVSDDLDAIVCGACNRWDATFWRPDTGEYVEIHNLDVPADTLIVFVAARELYSGELGEAGPGSYDRVAGFEDFIESVQTRGEPGAGTTDFGPWGGSIAFDNAQIPWYFGLDADRIGPDEYDFLSVAIHELGHVFGVGTSNSWDEQTDWFDALFYGDAAMAEYGEAVPVYDWDFAHWAPDTMSEVDGVPQEASMTPFVSAAERKLFTGLDFAGLADIGWEVAPREAVWEGPGFNWEDAVNWSTDVAPGVSHTAVLDAIPFRQPHINLDMAVGRLDLQQAPWSITGSGSLTVYGGGIQSAGNATNSIGVPVIMGNGFACTVADGNTLSLAGGLDAAGCTLTKDGPGTLSLASATGLGGLDVLAGTVRMTGANHVLVTPALTLDPDDGAALDLTQNHLVVDYNPKPNRYNEVLAAIKSGYSGGAWDSAGIICDGDTGTWALGVADNADDDFATITNLKGVPVDETSVLVRYTFYGNANLDDRVDAADLSKLLGNFGEVKADPEDVMAWFLGNFNYDDRVDAADLSKLLGNFGRIETGGTGEAPVGLGGGMALAPEPATLALAALGVAAMLARRQQKRQPQAKKRRST